MRIVKLLALSFLMGLPNVVQAAMLSFGGTSNGEDPVEIKSENLTVNQETGQAIFVGDVIVVQGELRVYAPRITVDYAETNGKTEIDTVTAMGGTTVVNGAESAEASRMVYSLKQSEIVMTGQVIAVNGPTTVTGDQMVVDTRSGNAEMSGNVKTILNAGAS
ncbi:MAG: lipopolysaccharide transport periplasmic protein LptA [Halocynthiibacter sp.]